MQRAVPCSLAVPLATALALIGAVPEATAREVPFADPQLLAENTLTGELVAAADLDGDGDLDLVGHGDENVRWFERSGDGTLLARTVYAYPAGTIVYEAVVGDLDRDGDPDVAAVRENNAEDIYVDWFENDGTPGQGAWTKRNAWWSDAGVGTEHRVRGLALGDVDADGDLDLVAGHWEHTVTGGDDGRIDWFENDGGAVPGWTSRTIQGWWSDREPRGLDLGDIDGDGDLDLAAMVPDDEDLAFGQVYWYVNDGTPGNGAWARHTIDDALGSEIYRVQLGDYDRDGDLDLVAQDYLGTLNLYENDGTPAGLWPVVSFGGGHEAGFADLDGNGWLDVLYFFPSGWLENRGGWFSERDLPGSASGRPAAADFDGDGDPDITYPDFGDLLRLENRTIHRSALLRDERNVNTLVDDAFDVAAGDLDGDGDLDLVSAAAGNDHVYWHHNDGTPGDDGSWSLSTLTDDLDGPRAVALGDLDGDGDLDVVVASYNDNSVSWLENDGTSANWTVRGVSAGAGGANDVALGDFDRDGDLDIACAQYVDDEVSWYRNSGASPPTFGAFFVDSLPYGGPRALAVGDVEGDGDLDLAVVSEDTDRVVWYANDGLPADGEWTRYRADNGESDGPKEVALADLDRDGDLDLLVAAYVGALALWYENDGDPTAWAPHSITTCNGVRGLATGDFDRDGDPDALVSCYDEDRVKLQVSNGGSPPDLSQTVSSLLGANGARTVLAVDLDRDGDLDGVAAQGTDGQIAWYENQGGQFRVIGANLAGSALYNDAVQGIFRAEVAHRGRAGDGSIELAAVAVRLEEAAGDPLSALQAAGLIDALRLYVDDGDGLFAPGSDALVASGSVAGIAAGGEVALDLADGLAAAAIAATAQRIYFVALDLANPYPGFAPSSLRVTLLTAGGPFTWEAEDRDHDLPLDLQWRAELSTATLPLIDVVFRDGFESGSTAAWSSVVP